LLTTKVRRDHHDLGELFATRLDALPVRIRIGRRTRIVADACKIGIGDAIQPASRCRCPALRVAVEGAVAQARKLIALQTERMPDADGLSRNMGCDHEAGCSQGRK
jgi:hypothetical protein